MAVSKMLLRALRIVSVLYSGCLSGLGRVRATPYPSHMYQAASLSLACAHKELTPLQSRYHFESGPQAHFLAY